MQAQGRALFVDRDGTINADTGYLYEIEKFELLPGAGEGLKKFRDMGYRIIVVTSQRGISLGMYTESEMHALHAHMREQLKPFGVEIEKIYFAAEGNAPGVNQKERLMRRAAQELGIELAQSVVVGDKTTDLEAGIPFGSLLIGVKTGKGLQDGAAEVRPHYLAESLLDAADFVESRWEK